MNKELSFVNIMKKVLNESDYIQLLMDISKRVEKEGINLFDCSENIFNKCCFIIYMMGISKKIEIQNYEFHAEDKSFEIDRNAFGKKYLKYIKQVESKRAVLIENMA